MKSELDRSGAPEDPLWVSVPLPLVRTFYPLGFSLRLSTNSELVLQAAEASWGLSQQVFSYPPVRVSLGVSESRTGAASPPAYRSRQHMFSAISDADNFVLCDMRSGYACGWITENAASDSSFLRFYFLDCAVYTLIEQLYLAPVHAAVVLKNGVGVLLCGDTGAGKSTMAYACARSGWTFVSDDAAFLLRDEQALSALGNCFSIRLKPDAPQLFPELLGWSASVRANGKLGFELCTTALPESVKTSPQATITDIVFLERSSQTDRRQLSRRPVSDPATVLGRPLWHGDDQVMAAQRASYERLAGARWWSMSYKDYQEGLSLLETLARGDRSLE
jgi:hypothetical protein